MLNANYPHSILPKHLDEEVARAHLESLNVKLTTMTAAQSDYLMIPLGGPYKPGESHLSLSPRTRLMKRSSQTTTDTRRSSFPLSSRLVPHRLPVLFLIHHKIICYAMRAVLPSIPPLRYHHGHQLALAFARILIP